MSDFFQQYKRSDISTLVTPRNGETKVGERLSIAADETLDAFLEKTPATFIVIGIAEDIGILANHGRAGSANTWMLFLRSFLNMQANNFTKAQKIAILGHFSFDRTKEEIERKAGRTDEKISDYRNAVSIIDNAVGELIRLIVSHKKIPIVVGGGHNNSYPLIKGTALGLNYSKGINCINLDAHLDYRAAEGRHSGNGFRYAKEEGLLKRYFAVAVHENFLNDSVVAEIRLHKDMEFVTYEDLFIRRKKKWRKALKAAVKFVGRKATGVELDLDSISDVPSSAATPCGVSVREALQYVDHTAVHCNVAYLHVCEGIASSENDVAKLICYLVTQFIKSYRNENKVPASGDKRHRS